MPVESDADRLSFVDNDEHGVAMTITAPGGSPNLVEGIFDEGYDLLADFGDGEGVSGSKPTFTCPSKLLPDGGPVGSVLLLEVNGKSRTFKVVEPKPDGTGMTELRLHETTVV